MRVVKDRILIHAAGRKRLVLEPSDVFFIEAVAGGSRIRVRSARALMDVRKLGELEPVFAAHDFLRVHRNHLVNLRRVKEIRRRKQGKDWELKLEPPVNRILPISREALAQVWAAYGE